MKIKNAFQKDIHLSELNQRYDLKLGLGILNEENELDLIHPWFKCRDYYNDMFWYVLFEEQTAHLFDDTDVHGFYISSQSKPLDIDNDYLLAIKRTYMEHEINLKDLNELEENLDLIPTSIIKNTKANYVLSFDKKWMHNPFAFSAYTSLVRIACAIEDTTYKWWDTYSYFHCVNHEYSGFLYLKGYTQTDHSIYKFKSFTDFIETIVTVLQWNFWKQKNNTELYNKLCKAMYETKAEYWRKQVSFEKFMNDYSGSSDFCYNIHDFGFSSLKLEEIDWC